MLKVRRTRREHADERCASRFTRNPQITKKPQTTRKPQNDSRAQCRRKKPQAKLSRVQAMRKAHPPRQSPKPRRPTAKTPLTDHEPHPRSGTCEDGIGVLLRCVEDQIAIGKYAKEMLMYLLEEAAQNEEAVGRLNSLWELQKKAMKSLRKSTAAILSNWPQPAMQRQPATPVPSRKRKAQPAGRSGGAKQTKKNNKKKKNGAKEGRVAAEDVADEGGGEEEGEEAAEDVDEEAEEVVEPAACQGAIATTVAQAADAATIWPRRVTPARPRGPSRLCQR